MRAYDIVLPCDDPIIEVEDTPHQSGNSVDCGVAVMYIVRQYFEQVPIIKEIGESELPKMRAKEKDYYED